MIDWPVERLGMRAGLWLVVVALAQPAAAETLIVAADGSGDHIAIQPAITAAAPGDTIFIRNGIYDHHEWFITPYGAWNTYVALKKSPLTFIGESRDGVIIGPETAEFDGTIRRPLHPMKT